MSAQARAEAAARRAAELVDPGSGRVASAVHSDPDIYELEQSRLFGRSWLFVAHESEIADVGDFVTRSMGEQSVIVSRTEDGSIRVLLNVCTHRGMRLECEDAGNRARFRCPYHGFSFANTGKLVAVPYQREAYAEGIDKDALGLVSARVETYRGMVFANWDHDAPSLVDELGAMAWYLDIMVGRAEMVAVGPPQRWVVPAAWKLPAENFASDAYHTATTHAFLPKLGLVEGVDFGKDGYHVDAGGGHGLGIGVQDDGPWYPPELRGEYEANLTAEQMDLLDRLKNFHGNVFPNLSFLIPNVIVMEGHKVSGTTLRLWQPLGRDRIEVWSWFLTEANAPEWWRELGRRAYTLTFGTSGVFEQDDTENWEAQTRNAMTTLSRGHGVDLHYAMGLGREPMSEPPGPGSVYEGKYNEAAARSYYRRWLDLLSLPLSADGSAPPPGDGEVRS